VLFSHIASNDQYFTGVAILNPNLTDTQVTIEIHREDGSLIDSITQTLPVRQRVARTLTEFFPSLADKNQTSGYIKVVSEKPIVSFSLFGTSSLLSAIPPQKIE
jgi:hypothetical protein